MCTGTKYQPNEGLSPCLVCPNGKKANTPYLDGGNTNCTCTGNQCAFDVNSPCVTPNDRIYLEMNENVATCKCVSGYKRNGNDCV